MKLSIDGVLYDPASLDRLTLREIMALEKATEDLGRPLKWSAIRAMAEAAAGAGLAESDDALWVIGLTIYASKLRAGEQVTFADALDVELGAIDWILEPGDEPDPSQDHTGAADPKAGSGPAGSRRVPQDHKKKSAPKSSRG